MRVLIVSQYFWPEAFRVNDLATALAERGHDVTVLTGQPNYETGSFAAGHTAFAPREERYGDVRVVRCPLVARGRGTGARLALNYLSFAASASVLAPFRTRDEFDVTLVYQMSPVTMAVPAFVLKALRGTPVVFWVQDLWPDALRATNKVTSDRLLRVMRRGVDRMYRASDRVLVQSEAFIGDIRAARVPDERIGYLPNWAESVYRPQDPDEAHTEDRDLPDGFRVMVAGNIGMAQAMGTVVDAANELRDVEDLRWIVVGDGRRRDWTRARVRNLGLDDRFCFVERRPVGDMPRYLALADVALVSLTRDPAFERTVPSRLQSYLACGRPVVAALDGEGARVTAESGAGIACPAEDAHALAGAVRALHGTSVDERERMGARGRAYFEQHFERELLVDRLEKHLRAVVMP